MEANAGTWSGSWLWMQCGQAEIPVLYWQDAPILPLSGVHLTFSISYEPTPISLSSGFPSNAKNSTPPPPNTHTHVLPPPQAHCAPSLSPSMGNYVLHFLSYATVTFLWQMHPHSHRRALQDVGVLMQAQKSLPIRQPPRQRDRHTDTKHPFVVWPWPIALATHYDITCHGPDQGWLTWGYWFMTHLPFTLLLLVNKKIWLLLWFLFYEIWVISVLISRGSKINRLLSEVMPGGTWRLQLGLRRL